EKKYDIAKFMYKKVDDREEYIPAIENNLGVIAALENDMETAFFYFNKLLNKYPYYFPTLANRGIIFLQYGLFKNAEEDLEIANSIRPDEKEILMAYGIS